MASKSGNSLSLNSILRILGAVIAIVIVLFLILGQANFLVGRSLLIAFGDTESVYKSAWLEWDGDVTAQQLVIHPYDIPDAEVAIRFENVHVETPGWWWFLRNTFDRKLRTAKLDRIHVTLSGGRVDNGMDPSLGDLGPFGAAASPFEAEGCMSDGMWSYGELEEMGLHPEPTTLEFDYKVEGEQLLTTIVLETKGVSRVKLERRSRLPDSGVNALVLDQVGSTALFERWEVEDQGFVAARNKYCGKKDGIDARRFLERHVETVERVLATVGLGMDEATRTTYRRFARDGGTIAFGGEYAIPLKIEEFYDLRDSGEAFTRMNGRVEYGGSTTLATWQRFDPKPFPENMEADSTYAAMLKERASIAPEVPATETLPDADATADATTATAEPGADIERPAQRRKRSSDAVVVVPPPAPETATPDMGLARIEGQAPDPGRALQWSDLANLRGHMVRIWTVHNPPRSVEILSADGDTIRVAAHVGGGTGEYTIQREGFLKAVLID